MIGHFTPGPRLVPRQGHKILRRHTRKYQPWQHPEAEELSARAHPAPRPLPTQACEACRHQRPLPQLDDAHQTFAYLNDEAFAPFYLAAAENVDETIVNTMLAAKDAPTQRPRGGICKAICPDTLVELVTGQRRRQRLAR